MSTTTIPGISTTRVLPVSDDFKELGSATAGSAKQDAKLIPLVATTISALSSSAFDVSAISQPVYVIALGASALGDGGGGIYMYSPSSTATVNGTTVVASNTGTGRWLAGTAAASQIQSDWTQASTTAPSFIKNKPTLGSAASQNTSAFDAAGTATAAVAALASSIASSVSTGFLDAGSLGIRTGGKLAFTPVGYAGGGTQTLRMDLGAYGAITLSANNNFNAAAVGFAGMFQIIDFINPTGGAFTLAWPSGMQWPLGGAPSSVAAGDILRVIVLSTGTTTSSLVGVAIGPGVPYLAPNELAVGPDGMSNAGQMVMTPIPYAAGGTQSLRFDLGAYASIPLVADSNFNSASGMQPGSFQVLDITNPSGLIRNLSWPTGIVWGPSAAPSTIANGGYIRVWFMSTGTITAGIRAFYVASGGGGGGVTQLVAGSGIALSPSGGTGTVTITATGLPTLPYILATAYGVTANGTTDDTAALTSALAATVAAGGCLLLPPGTMRITSDPFAGTAVTGFIAVQGVGRQVSRFRQDGATSGVTFNCSTGTPQNNAVNLKGFSVIGNNAGCTTGLMIDYGTTSLGSADLHSTITDVSVQEFTSEFYFRQCWSLQATDLFAFGDSGNYTAGSGLGTGASIVIDACINPLFENIQMRWSAKGFQAITTVTGGIYGTLSPTQGLQITNLISVEVSEVLSSLGGNGMGTIVLNNFTLDNGNISVSAHRTIHIENCGALLLSNGQILQNNGTDMCYLNNANQSQFLNVNFQSTANGVLNQLHFDGSSSDSLISGCLLGTGGGGGPVPIRCGASTSGIKASANNYASGSTANADAGSGNNISATNGF